jgi:hypothetical protein
MKDIESLKERVEAGELCAGLGTKADSICNQALEQFSTEAPDAANDDGLESIFDEKVRMCGWCDLCLRCLL